MANKVDPDMSCYQENLDTLRGMLSAPLLGEVPNVSDTSPEHVASFLDIGPLWDVHKITRLCFGL